MRNSRFTRILRDSRFRGLADKTSRQENHCKEFASFRQGSQAAFDEALASAAFGGRSRPFGVGLPFRRGHCKAGEIKPTEATGKHLFNCRFWFDSPVTLVHTFDQYRAGLPSVGRR
jgi:hypothetical protein